MDISFQAINRDEELTGIPEQLTLAEMNAYLVSINIFPGTPEYAQAMQNFGLIAGEDNTISEDEWDNFVTDDTEDGDDAGTFIEDGMSRVRWTAGHGESGDKQYREEHLHPDDTPGDPSFKFEHMDFNKDGRISNNEFDQYLTLHGITPQSPQYAQAWAAFGQLKASPNGVALDRSEYNNKAPTTIKALATLRNIGADTSLVTLFNISNSKQMDALFYAIAGQDGNKTEITKSDLVNYLIKQGMGPKLAEYIAEQIFSTPGLSSVNTGREKVIKAENWADVVSFQYITQQVAVTDETPQLFTLEEMETLAALGASTPQEGKKRAEFFVELYKQWLGQFGNNASRAIPSLNNFFSIFSALNSAIDFTQRINSGEFPNAGTLNPQNIIRALRTGSSDGLTPAEQAVYSKLSVVASTLKGGFIDALELVTQGTTELTPEAIQTAMQLYAVADDGVITAAEADLIMENLPDGLKERFNGRFSQLAKDGQVELSLTFTLGNFLAPLLNS